VKVLLDENFPLGLLRALRDDGIVADHIIALGWRGAPDSRIRERLNADVLFMTHDDDFLFGEAVAAVVVVSRVRQSRLLDQRIEIWRAAVRQLVRQADTVARLFELTDDGVLVPWREGSNT
jgi:hypothetical protein